VHPHGGPASGRRWRVTEHRDLFLSGLSNSWKYFKINIELWHGASPSYRTICAMGLCEPQEPEPRVSQSSGWIRVLGPGSRIVLDDHGRKVVVPMGSEELGAISRTARIKSQSAIAAAEQYGAT
jgi:hypothetical protein